MNIAITGTIGSGKSTVAAILGGLLSTGTLSADAICREELTLGARAWQVLRNSWPQRFFTTSGEIDRQYLRQAIFQDDGLRLKLEKVLHPLVHERLQKGIQANQRRKGFLLVEVPLLFESGWHQIFDWRIDVYVPDALCIMRASQRDQVSYSQVKKIIEVQMPAEEKAQLADTVIDNSGIFASTYTQTSLLAKKLHLQFEQSLQKNCC